MRSSFAPYIIVGLVIAAFGFGLVGEALFGFRPDQTQLLWGLLFSAVGVLLAQIGVIAWGVSLGTQDLHDNLVGLRRRLDWHEDDDEESD